jgi:Gpi18-like mannosyltransferase
LLLLILTIYLAYEKKYIWAGVAGALLTATRSTGVLVLIPLLFLFWIQIKKQYLIV